MLRSIPRKALLCIPIEFFWSAKQRFAWCLERGCAASVYNIKFMSIDFYLPQIDQFGKKKILMFLFYHKFY